MTSWQLTIDANDPGLLVAFWAPLLGYELQPAPEGFDTWNDWYRSVGVPDDELDTDGDGTDRIFDPTGNGPKIWFQIVPERKTLKNRLHLDVYVADRRTTPYDVRKDLVQAKVAELEALGATVRTISDDPEHARYSTLMLDPEGNEFCLS